jgi:hypothetical protein
MRGVVARAAAAVGALGALSAIVALPWAQYGGIGIGLSRFPGWGVYLTTAIVLNLVAGWAVGGGPGGRALLLLTGYTLGVATIMAALAVILRYRDATALFGPVVPAVIPVIGAGGPVAVLSALASGAATITAARDRKRSSSRRAS